MKTYTAPALTGSGDVVRQTLQGKSLNFEISGTQGDPAVKLAFNL